MTSSPTIEPTTIRSRDQRWKSKWIVVGLVFFLTWRSMYLVDQAWLSQFPLWLLLVLTGLLPHFVLLAFPFITRDRTDPRKLAVPNIRLCFRECLNAVYLVVVLFLVLVIVSYIVDLLSPGKPLTSEMSQMARSWPVIYTYLLLAFSFTFAPITEEVFFRGFLQNALAQRMPRAVATVLQSLVFGLGHLTHVSGFGNFCLAAFLGVVLTLIYQSRKTLLAPILVHAGINLIAAAGTLFVMAEHAKGPFLGVYPTPNATTCLIGEIGPGSAAAEGGLAVGDVITEVDGYHIDTFETLKLMLKTYSAGDTLTLTVDRNGEVNQIKVTLKERGFPR